MKRIPNIPSIIYFGNNKINYDESILSPIRSIAVIGSSSVEYNFGTGSGGNNRFFSNWGIHGWMCAYTRQRLMMAYNAVKNTYEFGVFGATNGMILTDSRITPAAIAAQPDAAMLYVSLNDLAGSATPAQMLASTQAIYNALIAGGIKTVIVQAPGPRNFDVAGGAGYWAKQQSLIALLQSWTSSSGIPFVDVNPVIQNPLNGNWLDGYTIDGTHPSALGAAHAGKALAVWALANLNLGPEPLSFPTRLNNLRGVNPYNTGGTASLAQFYSNFPGSRATPFLQNATDGGARWQGQTINLSTSSDSSTNGTQINKASRTISDCGLAVGQLIRTWIEIDLGNSGIQRLSINDFTNGSGVNRSGLMDGANNVNALIAGPSHDGPIVLVGPVFQIPAVATTYSGQVWVSGHMQNVVTTWRFRYSGCEVVNSYNPPPIGS